MKKYVIIMLFCLFNTFSYGQTEEETTTWLKEKLSKYIVGKDGNYTNVNVSVTSCQIEIDYVVNNQNWLTKIPLDQISFLPDGISTVGERITDQNITKKSSKVFTQKTIDFILKEGETDLRVRVKKAMAHLYTFCPKKKEAF
jgi:hypothetical protein